jgi:hypothetical protein
MEEAMSLARIVATALFASLLPAHSLCAVVVVDFDHAVGCCLKTPYLEDGFRIVPRAHYDIVSDLPGRTGYLGSRWLSSDTAGGGNPDYFGPLPPMPFQGAGGVVYLDHFGDTFNFRSFFPVGTQSMRPAVWSSKGGFFQAAADELMEIVELTGPEWTQVEWLLFSIDAGAGAPVMGIDQLTFIVPGVPEPTMLALMLVAFAGLGITHARGARRGSQYGNSLMAPRRELEEHSATLSR